MKNFSRSAWIAIAAIATIPATVAIAKSMDHAGSKQSEETRARLAEGRLAMAKTALKLTAEQEPLWAAVETELRASAKARADKRAEWKKEREARREARKEKKDGEAVKRPDISERFEKMSERMSERADRMKAFVTAFKPFYASLTEEQKDVLRPLMHKLTPGMGEGHGPRWAHKGWGPGGHDGHRGWRKHHRGASGDAAEHGSDKAAPADADDKSDSKD